MPRFEPATFRPTLVHHCLTTVEPSQVARTQTDLKWYLTSYPKGSQGFVWACTSRKSRRARLHLQTRTAGYCIKITNGCRFVTRCQQTKCKNSSNFIEILVDDISPHDISQLICNSATPASPPFNETSTNSSAVEYFATFGKRRRFEFQLFLHRRSSKHSWLERSCAVECRTNHPTKKNLPPLTTKS